MRHALSTVVALPMPTWTLAGRTWRLALVGLVQLLIHSAPTLASAQQVVLRPHNEEGSQLVYRVTLQQETQMPGLGSEVINQTETMRWTVQSVAPDGDATITVTTEHTSVELVGLAGNEFYDSDSDDAPATPAAQLAAARVGLSYSMVMGADGRVKAVQGTEQLIEVMLASLPPEAEAMVEQMFNEDVLMQQMSQVFPTDPVGPDDSWQNSTSTTNPMFGTMTTNLTFVLDGVEQRDGRTVALISITGEIVFGDASGGPLAGLGDVVIGDTEMLGTMTFDVDRGVILSNDTTNNVTVTVSVAGQSMSVTTATVSSQELIEYIPAA